MARAYLNSLCFPADNLGAALLLLSELRKGVASLLAENLLSLPVLCDAPASKLPLSPTYEVLGSALGYAGGRHRDTILFFLLALDQRAPAYAALNAEQQLDAQSHIIVGIADKEIVEAGSLVSCAMDGGVLLSIGTSQLWRSDCVSFKVLLASSGEPQELSVSNVWSRESAESIRTRLKSENSKHLFENWDQLSGGAFRSAQLDTWFSECRSRPGLEQVIMRTVSLACVNAYRPDGNLVKKLTGEAAQGLMELRAWHNGSNNVRLLFLRDSSGRVTFGYGGVKTSPDWYDYAIQQALRHISDMK